VFGANYLFPKSGPSNPHVALLESLRLTLILALCVAPAFAQTASYTDDNPSVSPDGKKIAFMC
jgi:WD40-like Beta Propeller Repeat